MNSAEHYTTRYLETDDLDQYNALLRYTFHASRSGWCRTRRWSCRSSWRRR